jgi:hypothetical protein
VKTLGLGQREMKSRQAGKRHGAVSMSPARVAEFLGFVAAVLSLVVLIQQGFALGFGAPLEAILHYYARFVDLALGWAHEPLVELLRALNVDLHLYPHWKSLIVPMWLYVAADVRVMVQIRRPRSALFFAVVGAVLALVAAVAAGLAPLDDRDMGAVGYPVGALFLYNIVQAFWDATFHRSDGRTWWQTFSYYTTWFALGNLVLGGAVLLIGAQGSGPSFAGKNVALLLAFIALLALRNLTVSARAAWRHRQPGQTWRERFGELNNTRLGFAVLATLAGVLAFLLSNAGLSAAGL